MNRKSDNFERFRWSCFDESFGATRDGIDREALLALTMEERAEAERMILEALERTTDSRPFSAAGVMRLHTAAPILKQRLSQGFDQRFDYLRVYAAHSLYLIEQWADASGILVDILQNTPKTNLHQWTRMMAVEALADFGQNPVTLPIIFATVEDEDDFIGFLAIKALKTVYVRDEEVSRLPLQLEQTQIEPNRYVPEQLERRKELFASLSKVTCLTMPVVRMKENDKDAKKEHAPDYKQMLLFTEGEA